MEEQLVLTIAQDRNRNSDVLSPDFLTWGKKSCFRAFEAKTQQPHPLKMLHFVAE